MLTQCTHCGANYELPDKMLGKKARCKSCQKLFVLTPIEEEVELGDPVPPSRGGSTAQLNPVSHDTISGDPLGALADAAGSSSAHLKPTHRNAITSSASVSHSEDEELRGKKRMAKGASAAMGLGITAVCLAVGGGICAIIAMVNGKEDGLLITMGVIALGLLAISAIIGMIAVVNGTSAAGKIRKARHPLSGKSQASTGSITGAIALGLVLITFIAGGIWLGKRGGITFEKEVSADEAG